MIDFGTVKPGTTLNIPFHTFSSDDPAASVTITGLATTDIEVYKDGGNTARASDSGYALLGTDGIDEFGTGVHGFSVDLADNTTDDFYEAGSQYFVVIASITVDGATVNFVAATWRIGYPGALLDTIITTRTSATVFVLEEGAPDNDAYNGCIVYIHDQASAVQFEIGVCSDYSGGDTTLTLAADPGIFVTVAGDNISIMPPANVTAWNNVLLATTNPLPNAAAETAGGLYTRGTGAGQINQANNGEIDVDCNRWNGGLIPAQGVTGVPEVDVTHHTAGIAPTPATTGVPDVNTVEFLDTAVVLSNGLPDVNIEDWLGTIVTAATAGVPNVNTTEFLGTAVVLSNGLPDTNVENWLGTLVAAATAGIPNINAVRWNNGLIPAQGVTGVPEVDVTHFVAGLAPTPATTGVPDANTVEFLDTAVILSNGLPDANVENWLGTIVTAATAGRPDVNASALDDSTNAAAVLSDMLKDGVIGTADSGSTTSITDAARTEADDRWNGSMIVITSGASAGQARIITEFANTGGVITFAPAVTTNLNTETYVIIPKAGVDVQSWLGTESAMAAPNALVGGAIEADVVSWLATAVATPTVAGVPEVDITHMVGGVVPTPATTGIPDVNVREWLDTAAATPTVAGVPEVDITHMVGGVVPTPATIGIPDVNVREWLDTAVTLSAGAPDVNIQSTDNIALSTQQKTDVNAEVVDVVATDTIAELSQGVPVTNPTIVTAIMLQYMALRNKLDVATVATDTLEIHNDAGTRIAQKLLTDDGADYSEAKMTSGA